MRKKLREMKYGKTPSYGKTLWLFMKELDYDWILHVAYS